MWGLRWAMTGPSPKRGVPRDHLGELPSSQMGELRPSVAQARPEAKRLTFPGFLYLKGGNLSSLNWLRLW